MNSFMVVVVDSFMNCKYKIFYAWIRIWNIKFQFEFPVVRFLSSIFPRRSFLTHRYLNTSFRKKVHYEKTSVLTSLIRVKYLRERLCFFYCHFNSFQYKFLGMYKRYGISNNFSCKCINYCCKVEVYSLVDNVSKISSPNSIYLYRTNIFCSIWYLGIWKSYVRMFYELSTESYLCFYVKSLHKSSCFFKAYAHTPGNASMTIPRVLFMNSF